MTRILIENSSSVAAVDYDTDKFVLDIDFKTGSRYRYLGVEPEVYHEMMIADSIGHFLATRIKPKYDVEKLMEYVDLTNPGRWIFPTGKKP